MKILIVSTSRGDFGHLIPLLFAAGLNTKVEASFLATSRQHPNALDTLPRGLHEISQLGVDLPEHIGDWSNYLCNLGDLFGNYLETRSFECCVLLGDRIELLTLATILTLNGIPIVHLHGGETSLGAVDNLVRDAVSKLASLHLVSRPEHLQKLSRIGEEESRIFLSGALAVDNVYRIPLLERTVVEKLLGFEIQDNALLVTVHPVTAGTSGMHEINNFFDDLELLGRPIVCTFPNQDPGSDYVRERIARLKQSLPEAVQVVENMGIDLYFSMVSLCEFVVGNSSSGIIDAPILGKASIDFGSRQQGRVAPKSVLRCGSGGGDLLALFRDRMKLGSAIESAKSIDTLRFYGLPGVAERMIEIMLSNRDLITSVKRT